MKTRRKTVKYRYFVAMAVGLVAALAAAGCGAAPTSVATQSQATPTQPSATATRGVEPALPAPTRPTFQAGPSGATPSGAPATPEITPPAEAQAVVRLAEEDLAQRLGLEPDQIRVVSVQAVEWSDTSLGCPQPGMMYAQVITPGFRVTLEAEGQTYDYHTNQSDHVILCQTGGAGSGAITPPAGAEDTIRLVRQDLAQRAGVAPEAIQLLSVEAVQWPDASLGCPQPGMMYAQVVTPGFRLVLEAEGTQFNYHADTSRFVVLCEE
jgi:hypothetical protein